MNTRSGAIMLPMDSEDSGLMSEALARSLQPDPWDDLKITVIMDGVKIGTCEDQACLDEITDHVALVVEYKNERRRSILQIAGVLGLLCAIAGWAIIGWALL